METTKNWCKHELPPCAEGPRAPLSVLRSSPSKAQDNRSLNSVALYSVSQCTGSWPIHRKCRGGKRSLEVMLRKELRDSLGQLPHSGYLGVPRSTPQVEVFAEGHRASTGTQSS